MLLSEAIETVTKLSLHFEISSPLVKHSKWRKGKSHGSYYVPIDREIHLSLVFATKNLLHEFAHHLQYNRGGSKHDYIFWNALYEVTNWFYGDFRRYPWRREYKRGYKFYLNKVRRREMFILEDEVIKPEKKSSFPFIDIKVKGGLWIVAAEGENLEKVATKVRNATNNFKKGHKDYNLSVHVYKDLGKILVYRDKTEAEIATLPAD